LTLPGDGPKGGVRIPIRNAASSAQWISEGSAATGSAATTIAMELFPSTVSAVTAITRRMVTSLGQPGFVDFTIEEMMTSCAVELDRAVINGTGFNQPFGLAQNAGIPSVATIGDSGTGGTMADSCLVAMEELVGNANGDSSADCRLGFVTSPRGRSQL
jgi:HK97 family phage major capsid protein